jgi:hypothetical protein
MTSKYVPKGVFCFPTHGTVHAGLQQAQNMYQFAESQCRPSSSAGTVLVNQIKVFNQMTLPFISTMIVSTKFNSETLKEILNSSQNNFNFKLEGP